MNSYVRSAFCLEFDSLFSSGLSLVCVVLSVFNAPFFS
nr:MAG TPA: hypothetical protein [Caudoviricetes sp.]DAU79885.1 MAG TPA: hypothetical protein [Caudoviricetes sp.]DAV79039.1 MAG TPA: hypothetical protein [Caudoviricetes sp.]